MPRGTGLVETVHDDGVLPAGGVLLPSEIAEGVLLRWVGGEWRVGAHAALHGLRMRQCKHLNGTQVTVLRALDAAGCIDVCATTDPGEPCWRVQACHLRLCTVQHWLRFSASWRDARDWAGEVSWLPPSAFDVDGARATADLLHDMAGEVFPGREGERGVSVDAALYPRVRPRTNLADTARGNNWVPEEPAVLRVTPVPQQCHPATTKVIPQLPRKRWPAGKPHPFPQEICRAPRDGEHGTPFERVVEWCDAYDTEWHKFLRGQQRGKAYHRFDYDQLPGGRGGLLIEDYANSECAGIHWDHRPYWESGGTLPCVPFEDEHPSLHTDWRLELIAQDAAEMGHTDENAIFELTQIGFRSFSGAVDDNCVMLFPNRVGFFKDKAALDFVRDKSEEERHGFVVPKLYGSCQYPQLLCCRLHPRNVCVQRLPKDIVHDDGTTEPAYKRR